MTISDHQQSWGYQDGPWKGPGPPLLVAADFKKFFFISIHKPPASIGFAHIKHALAVTVEPFKISPRHGGVAYELSQDPNCNEIHFCATDITNYNAERGNEKELRYENIRKSLAGRWRRVHDG